MPASGSEVMISGGGVCSGMGYWNRSTLPRFARAPRAAEFDGRCQGERRREHCGKCRRERGAGGRWERALGGAKWGTSERAELGT
jgi:hypothetical protein